MLPVARVFVAIPGPIGLLPGGPAAPPQIMNGMPGPVAGGSPGLAGGTTPRRGVELVEEEKRSGRRPDGAVDGREAQGDGAMLLPTEAHGRGDPRSRSMRRSMRLLKSTLDCI